MSDQDGKHRGGSMRPRAPTEIRIQGLCKAFGGNPVLRGIDLEIGRGDLVAIVGESGCGKTVLLNHVLGEVQSDTGRIWIADHGQPGAPLVDLAELSDEEVARIHMQWGVVFQKNALFSGSIYDNIALWLREVKSFEDAAIIPIAQSVLAAVALPTDAVFLETSTDSLSGGMAKRLAIARALSMDPIAIFYDEPTTGLDPVNAAQIHDLILATHRHQAPNGIERTTIIITHDKDLLSRLRPRTVMLHDGAVSFDGPFEKFQASDSPIIRPYFDLMPALQSGALRNRPSRAEGSISKAPASAKTR